MFWSAAASMGDSACGSTSREAHSSALLPSSPGDICMHLSRSIQVGVVPPPVPCDCLAAGSPRQREKALEIVCTSSPKVSWGSGVLGVLRRTAAQYQVLQVYTLGPTVPSPSPRGGKERSMINDEPSFVSETYSYRRSTLQPSSTCHLPVSMGQSCDILASFSSRRHPFFSSNISRVDQDQHCMESCQISSLFVLLSRMK
ncbi:hypothetical protein F4779DRAFT_480696 [Xylariaceae sp. FL0662B]|nr:hypothetical protein F4779DRAFT_480696 [Xylariaceae sp. FL0662B]